MDFKAYVLTVIPDVCTSNGRDVNATGLLDKMGLYGKVEKLEDVIARETAPFKATIDSLVKQNEAIKEHDLDDFDMTILRSARDAKQKELEVKDIQIAELRTEIKKVVDFNDRKQQELTAFITAFTEKYTEN